jgi:hypothetical protein
MRVELEFHDTEVEKISQDGPRIVIQLAAYVHHWSKASGAWKGEGWARPVRMSLVGTLDATQENDTGALETGELEAGKKSLLHMVPLPFSEPGKATLRLEFKSGVVLDFSGQDLQIEAVGEGKFLEKLPDEFAPLND